MNGNFDRAVRHLAALSAISRTSDYSSSVQELVIQVVAIENPFTLKTPENVKEATDVFFGIPLDVRVVSEAIDSLVSGDRIRTDFGSYSLSDAELSLRQNQVEQSRALEENVYENWRKEIEANDSGPAPLGFERLKACMVEYLGKAFRQHGIETAQLLDSTSALAKVTTESLVHVLNETIVRHFSDKDEEAIARACITRFFQNTDDHPERRRYLIELADGAYSFYTFFIDPEVAGRIRQSLQKLEFYLDTNFLWGLLGLHENQYVQSSVELFGVARIHNLPFSFRYHKITEQELLTSVAGSGGSLRQRAWSASISEVLKRNPFLSGIERKYHEKNAERKTDVETFLRPYENISRIVREEGIAIDMRDIEWGEGVNTLFHEFQDYLEQIEKEKSYEAMQHDVKMLWLIRKLRTNAKNPLHAGVLFLTCDTRLYNFDVRNTRKYKIPPSTILPNVLLQILRPVLQQAEDFDRLFVKTFCLPEFRSYSKKSSKAVQEMAAILSAVDGLPLETAKQMLLDGILVKSVAEAASPNEVAVKINEDLVHRIGAITKQLSDFQTEVNNIKSDGEAKIKQTADDVRRAQEESERQRKLREQVEENLRVAREALAQSELDSKQRQDALDKIHRRSALRKDILLFVAALIISAFVCGGLFLRGYLTEKKKLIGVFLGLTLLMMCFIFRKKREWALAFLAGGIACLGWEMR